VDEVQRVCVRRRTSRALNNKFVLHLLKRPKHQREWRAELVTIGAALLGLGDALGLALAAHIGLEGGKGCSSF